MDTGVLSELKEATMALADGEAGDNQNYKELNKRLTGLLADIAHHIEDARTNLIEVKPNLVDSSEGSSSASGHLGDIDKTLADAADRLFNITENAIDDSDKSSAILNTLKESLSSGNADNLEAVNQLISINDATKASLNEVFIALSFQDLAGQKIMKITDLIEDVEKRILQVLLVLGISGSEDSTSSDEHLENLSADAGPLQQNLVDDILKDFGL